MEFSGDLLKSFALSLGDTKVSKQSEAEKQRSKQDEHVTVQPSLKIQKYESKKRVRRESVPEDTSAHILACVYSMRVLAAYLYVGKGHAYDEVAGPVAAAGESDGRRPRPLAEQLSHYEPRDGTRTDLKETHEEEDS